MRAVIVRSNVTAGARSDPDTEGKRGLFFALVERPSRAIPRRQAAHAGVVIVKSAVAGSRLRHVLLQQGSRQ